MNTPERYLEIVTSQLKKIVEEQPEKLQQASQWVATALSKERFVYTVGSGHSHALAEETFYRAGGLARCVAILDENLMVHKSASESTEWERKEGYAARVLENYGLTAGDVLFVISNSGRNAVPIEMALEGNKRGAKTIAITSSQHSSAFASRHSSGKKLSEVAQLTIDNRSVAGDASIEINGFPQKVGPTSTITSAFILHSIFAMAVETCLGRGVNPEVYPSINSDAGQLTIELTKKYKGIIPHL